MGLIGGFLSLFGNPKRVLAAAKALEPEWDLSTQEWRKRLNPKSFSVLREEGTERPFSSELNNEKREGIFYCAGCGLPLFASKTKFDSGTGWPSFWDPLPNAIKTKVDFKQSVM